MGSDRRLTRSSTGGLVAIVALLAGVLVGFWAATAISGSEAAAPRFPTVPPTVLASPSTVTSPPETPSSASQETPTPSSASPAAQTPSSASLLLWTSGGLAPGLAASVAGLDEVDSSTVVRGDQLDLVGSTTADGAVVSDLVDGWRIPLDVLAVDPAVYLAVIDSWAPISPSDAAAFAALGPAPGRAVLTETSAAQRGVGTGGHLDLITGTVEIVGVVDDVVGAGAEVIVDLGTGSELGVDTERYILIESRASRSGIEAVLTGLTAAPLRLRAPGETPYPRHGDAVLPQLVVKAVFGEFAYRPLSGRDVEIDPSWIEEHIVTVDLPLVGTTRCHRDVVPLVEAALSDLVNRSLSQLIDAAGFAGCFAPRLIGPGLGMSRHAWGIAVDLNAYDNPAGSTTMKDVRLVDAMAEQGFGWGGQWLNPDAMHFEVVDPPGPSLETTVVPPS